MTTVEGFEIRSEYSRGEDHDKNTSLLTTNRATRLASAECSKVSTLLRCLRNVFWNTATISWCHHDAFRAGTRKWMPTTGRGICKLWKETPSWWVKELWHLPQVLSLSFLHSPFHWLFLVFYCVQFRGSLGALMCFIFLVIIILVVDLRYIFGFLNA